MGKLLTDCFKYLFIIFTKQESPRQGRRLYTECVVSMV